MIASPRIVYQALFWIWLAIFLASLAAIFLGIAGFSNQSLENALGYFMLGGIGFFFSAFPLTGYHKILKGQNGAPLVYAPCFLAAFMLFPVSLTALGGGDLSAFLVVLTTAFMIANVVFGWRAK